MTATGSKPFRRRPSRTLRVRAVDGFAEPITLEVQCEQWLHAQTGR